MARSTYIYLVKKYCDYDYPGDPLAAFTVKHELVTWLRRKTEAERADMELWRICDGTWPSKEPETMDMDELLA